MTKESTNPDFSRLHVVTDAEIKEVKARRRAAALAALQPLSIEDFREALRLLNAYGYTGIHEKEVLDRYDEESYGPNTDTFTADGNALQDLLTKYRVLLEDED